MRVLMLSRALPAHGPGGLGASALDLAQALARAGARVRLLTTAGGAPPDRVAGLAVEALDAPPGRYSPAWWRESVTAWEREAGRTDAILSVSSAANALAARRPACPIVFQAHGTALGEVASKLAAGTPRAVAGLGRSLWWGAVRDRAYRRYDAVCPVSEAVRRQLAAWPTRALVGATPVHRIRNGVDEAAFRFDPGARARLRGALGLDAATPLALYAGRLQADKGPLRAVAAVGAAHRRGAAVELAVLGSGPLEAALAAALARDPVLAAGVHRLGARPRGDVAGWLSAADALVLPTRRAEGLPLIVLEALASGLPVLTTAAGAGGEAALPCRRLDADDPHGLALALAALEPAPGGPGRRASRLPPSFSLADAAGAYLELFEALAGGARRPLAA